ncbi:MAG TPA: elongation factor P [Chloroflexota bacterium]|nr:elongation factor P [Chloroflexota bacterium]
MISTGDLRRGLTIDIDGELWSVLEYHHLKLGRGSAQVRIKMRNLRSGATIERSVQAGEKFRRANLDRHSVQYLYREDGLFHFMDADTFDQIAMTSEQLGDARDYLKDNMELELMTFEGEPISIELPNSVELQIVETDPGFRGDTAAGGTKPAKLETGKVVQVPLFVEEGERIRVDTRTGQYLERL